MSHPQRFYLWSSFASGDITCLLRASSGGTHLCSVEQHQITCLFCLSCHCNSVPGSAPAQPEPLFLIEQGSQILAIWSILFLIEQGSQILAIWSIFFGHSLVCQHLASSVVPMTFLRSELEKSHLKPQWAEENSLQ
jgi:hypothetical protein